MKNKISACLVVYNEEPIIRRCLESIKNIADEIIVIHDGECKDKTLEIAREYTDKIYIEEHIGIAEPLRSKSYEYATGEWILQIDADEFFDKEDERRILKLINSNKADAYVFKWELWDGKNPRRFPGLMKLCFFKKGKITYQGLPQAAVTVLGTRENADITLHHRPTYENISWATANRRRESWLRAHVPYFFPEKVTYICFNATIDSWIEYTKKVRKHPIFYLAWYPLKNFLGQLKGGLWKSFVGFNIAMQQYVYYLVLYWRVWKIEQNEYGKRHL